MTVKFINLLFDPKKVLVPLTLMLITLIFSRKNAVTINFLIIIYYATFFLIKYFIHMPRPFIVFNHLHHLYIHKYLSAYNSFPSGHVGGVAIIIYSVIKLLPQNNIYDIVMNIVALIVLSVVGIVRIYSGVHWPLDVLAGWIIGYLLVEIAFSLKLR